jgi:hypothetical protein
MEKGSRAILLSVKYRKRRRRRRFTYPISPEDLNLIIWDDNTVEPITGADYEDKNISCEA